MTTPRLLGAAGVCLGALAFGELTLGRSGPMGIFLAGALFAIGELWSRVLIRPAPPALLRLGLGATAGLIGLPLVALVLHLAGVPIRALSLTAGLAVLTAGLGGVALLRERSGAAVADPRFARTLAAVAIPGVVALVVGGAATFAYVRMPHPPEPGFTSVALGGWAAGIARPVTIPAGGLDVPIRVSSAGRPPAVEPLAVRIGDRPAGPPQPVEVAADSTRAVRVHVPAPPGAGLHRVEISLGAASTVFYARGRGAAPHGRACGAGPC
ncbi:hypothetical protein ACFQS1_15285 [Paractinoplanes rhizophilus]|uniref:Uncharacterized protein n=1 Tax=Paractinoplanes rhizophilus TaxID=1416877 RepID=A0ABW2HQG5_9ACTN